MSATLRVYVGPFFTVPEQDVVVWRRDSWCANTALCGTLADPVRPLFCAHCGDLLRTKDVQSTERRAPTPDDLEGSWRSDVVTVVQCGGQSVWLPNEQRTGAHFTDDTAPMVHTLDGQRIEDELALFVNWPWHQALIRAFNADYGVTLLASYGVVPYFGSPPPGAARG